MPVLPRCPACSYDLSGIVESWADAWPLRGVCPECGRGLDWGAVVERRDCPPAWSFEHGERVNSRRAAVTLARLVEPVSFWCAMRGARTSRPGRVALLLGGGCAACVLLGAALAAWIVGESVVGMSMTPSSLLADSYGGHAREAVIYLFVWLLGSAAGLAPFGARRTRFFGALASAVLYACVFLAALWTVLATAAMVDVYRFAALGLAQGIGEAVAVFCIAGAWVWMVAGWAAAVGLRLPLRRRLVAWLVSQVCAAGAVAAFGFIDRYLPF